MRIMPRFKKRNTSIAKKALTLAKKNRRNIGKREMKFAFDTHPNVDVSSTGVFQLINAIQQGTTANSRIGEEYDIIGIELKTVAQGNELDQRAFIRVMIVQDKQPNGVQFALSELLEVTTSPVHITSGYNYSFSKRFNVLYDRVHSYQNNGQETSHSKWFRKKSIKVKCNSTNSGTIVDIEKNAIWLLVFGDSGGNPVVLSSFARVWYTDS